jgi:predicted XRE-type DNA-binding protein
MKALRPCVTPETANRFDINYGDLLKLSKISYNDRKKALPDFTVLSKKNKQLDNNFGSVVTVIQGSDNVFEDLGFGALEAAILKVRADLMIKLRQYILEQRLTTEQAADFFGKTQLQISNLMDGEIDLFNVEGLISMLVKAGMQVKVEVALYT